MANTSNPYNKRSVDYDVSEEMMGLPRRYYQDSSIYQEELEKIDAIAEPERMARFQSAIDFWDLPHRQDWTVCEQMQLGIQSQRFERGLYAPSEDILFALDQEILKALGHNNPAN